MAELPHHLIIKHPFCILAKVGCGRFPADQLQCVLNWLLSFKVIHLSLNNTGLHNKLKVVVPSFYTHICRYIHLTWDELKYKAKVKQNNIYSYWSDVGSSDGDRDLLRYGHTFLLLVQCHPFQGALLVANPNDEFFPPSAGLTAPMDLGVCLLLTFDTCTAEY